MTISSNDHGAKQGAKQASNVRTVDAKAAWAAAFAEAKLRDVEFTTLSGSKRAPV